VSPTGAAKPPAMPAAAKGTGPAAAEAFARYYVALINYAMASGQTSPMRAMASKSCSGCQVLAHAVDKVYLHSGSVSGGEWEVLRTLRTPPIADDATTVRMKVRVSKQIVVANSAAAPSTSVPNDGRLTVHLRNRNGAWTVAELDAYA
jgi:hypothetical protein